MQLHHVAVLQFFAHDILNMLGWNPSDETMPFLSPQIQTFVDEAFIFLMEKNKTVIKRTI